MAMLCVLAWSMFHHILNLNILWLGTTNGPRVCSLVILLEIESTINDDPKILYESIYKGNEVVILAWFSTLGIGHYCWLCNPINQLLSNHKTKHLISII
jgi:hypothetical protein